MHLTVEEVELTISDYINLKTPKSDHELGIQLFTSARRVEQQLHIMVQEQEQERLLQEGRNEQVILYHYRIALNQLKLRHLKRIYSYISGNTGFDFSYIKSVLRISN
jgi:hypothetical protein